MKTNEYCFYDFKMEYHVELFNLVRKAWFFTYSKIMDSKILIERINDWYSEENHKGIADNVKNKLYFFKVLIHNKVIIGFVSGNINEGKLDRLYIDPDLVGSGIGTKLLTIFIDELRKIKSTKCILFCDKKNSLGIDYYKRKGFVIIEEDEEDYKMEYKIEY